MLSSQTAVAGKVAAGSSQGFRLDPFALPVRHSPSPEAPAFTLDRDRVVVQQPVSGRLTTMAVPIAEYAGVSVRIEAVGDAGDIRVIVELMHSDPDLTLPLVVAAEPEDAAADWMAWARTLNMPLLVIESDGTVASPLSRIGGLNVSPPGTRRNRALFRGRRSRYIRRRKAGRSDGLKMFSGREIIARS